VDELQAALLPHAEVDHAGDDPIGARRPQAAVAAALAARAIEEAARDPADERGLAGAARPDEEQARESFFVEQRHELIEHRIDADRGAEPARARELDPVLRDRLERRRGSTAAVFRLLAFAAASTGLHGRISSSTSRRTSYSDAPSSPISAANTSDRIVSGTAPRSSLTNVQSNRGTITRYSGAPSILAAA